MSSNSIFNMEGEMTKEATLRLYCAFPHLNLILQISELTAQAARSRSWDP